MEEQRGRGRAERKRERDFTCWFILQMASMTGTGPDESQEPEAPSECPKDLGHHPLPPQAR